jgi:hypothetical protein
MAYRNGTYVAFHADGNNIPGKTDIDYYNLMRAWHAKGDDDFTMVNSHDKSRAVRDSSLNATLRSSLLERLRNSRNMVLIIGETTKNDTDWVPFEIQQAVDTYRIPIIVAYTTCEGPIRDPSALSRYWPTALSARINGGSINAIHIPFKKAPLNAAIDQFSHNQLPNGGGLGYYDAAAYKSWGIQG